MVGRWRERARPGTLTPGSGWASRPRRPAVGLTVLHLARSEHAALVRETQDKGQTHDESDAAIGQSSTESGHPVCIPVVRVKTALRSSGGNDT